VRFGSASGWYFNPAGFAAGSHVTTTIAPGFSGRLGPRASRSRNPASPIPAPNTTIARTIQRPGSVRVAIRASVARPRDR